MDELSERDECQQGSDGEEDDGDSNHKHLFDGCKDNGGDDSENNENNKKEFAPLCREGGSEIEIERER